MYKRRNAVKPMSSTVAMVKEMVSAKQRTPYQPENQGNDENYALPIRSITITAKVAQASAITELALADACGILVLLGFGAGATVQAFDVNGVISADALREYLKSFKMRIASINYECLEDASQLNNKITFQSGSLDGRSTTSALFDTAPDKRNTQFQSTLQTVTPNKDAWLTNASGIFVPTSSLAGSDKTVSLTLLFDKIEAY